MGEKMKLEILLATMNQKDDSILSNMRVKSDIIVCNQNSSSFEFKSYKKENFDVKWYNFSEKGVGLNRNNALMRSSGEICLIADDDVIYEDDYEEIILDEFKKNPKADVILFNIHSSPEDHRYECKKKHKVHLYNCGKFGAVRIAFKRNSVIKNAISFNLLFGGGAIFSAGEDNMFIRDCIRKGLKVIAVEPYILKLDYSRASTWFKGYNEKYFEDMGSSYVYHYGRLAFLVAFIQLLRKRNKLLSEFSFISALSCIKRGIKKYKEL